MRVGLERLACTHARIMELVQRVKELEVILHVMLHTSPHKWWVLLGETRTGGRLSTAYVEERQP